MSTPVNQFRFANDEVVVSIPASAGTQLRAVSLDLGSVDMNPATGFKPIRLLANIAIEEAAKPGAFLTELPAPVQITLKYRGSDKQAAGTDALQFAFWNGTQWVPFTSQKHNLVVTPDANPARGGTATLTITRWGDPVIGIGH